MAFVQDYTSASSKKVKPIWILLKQDAVNGSGMLVWNKLTSGLQQTS